MTSETGTAQTQPYLIAFDTVNIKKQTTRNKQIPTFNNQILNIYYLVIEFCYLDIVCNLILVICNLPDRAQRDMVGGCRTSTSLLIELVEGTWKGPP